MYLNRDIEKTLKRYLRFPVIAIMGPRQSGKTTLVQKYFKEHTFLSFEDPATREFAQTDPNGFLKQHENEFGIILDEFQYVPQILSYIQLEADAKNRPGYFIITGSQNFLMNQAITQSLAGRVGILTLLPFSINELKEHKILQDNAQDLILDGSYPRIYNDPEIYKTDVYSSYIHTYIERDVRQLINVGDLRTFQKFLTLCAGRIGQLLNLAEIATVCGISAPTATKWLSVLEASYIVFILQPHFNNFNKRLTKTPKLYFYDTGIACNLLGINNSKAFMASPFRGPLFENLIISDLMKQYFNNGTRPAIYFWRDNNGRIEVDCVVDTGSGLVPIEIKASSTIIPSFFYSMTEWNEISQTNPEDNYLVYAGDSGQKRKYGHVLTWKDMGNLIDKINKN